MTEYHKMKNKYIDVDVKAASQSTHPQTVYAQSQLQQDNIDPRRPASTLYESATKSNDQHMYNSIQRTNNLIVKKLISHNRASVSKKRMFTFKDRKRLLIENIRLQNEIKRKGEICSRILDFFIRMRLKYSLEYRDGAH